MGENTATETGVWAGLLISSLVPDSETRVSLHQTWWLICLVSLLDAANISVALESLERSRNMG